MILKNNGRKLNVFDDRGVVRSTKYFGKKKKNTKERDKINNDNKR